MKAAKLSTTVDWAVDKFHSGRILGIKKGRAGHNRATFDVSLQTLPVDNFSDFRASRVGA